MDALSISRNVHALDTVRHSSRGTRFPTFDIFPIFAKRWYTLLLVDTNHSIIFSVIKHDSARIEVFVDFEKIVTFDHPLQSPNYFLHDVYCLLFLTLVSAF